MYLSQKTEIFPNQNQKEMIKQCIGNRRYIYNTALWILNQNYKSLKDVKKKNIIEIRDFLRHDKTHKEVISKTPNQILDTALEDLTKACQSLWKKGKKINYQKKSLNKSFRIYRKNETNFKYNNEENLYLNIVRLGKLKMAEPIKDEFLNGIIKEVTISVNAGRYWLSLVIDVPKIKKAKKTYKKIAFDWGVKTFLTGYDGKDFFEVDFDRKKMERLNKNIDRKQRKLSAKCVLIEELENGKQLEYNSNGRQKALKEVQQAYLDKKNYQEDFLKKLAYYLVNNYDYVILEDLNMSFITSNKRLAKSTYENMFYKTKSIIFNKFDMNDKSIHQVSKSFPSTQLCSQCGSIKVKENKLTLNDRDYICQCGNHMDRDENAAINLYNASELTKINLRVAS